MGLNHPVDLEAWRRWEARRRPLRRVIGLAQRPLKPTRVSPAAVLSTNAATAESPSVLILLDSLSPTSRLALLEARRFLDPEMVGVLSPAGLGVYGDAVERPVDDVELGKLVQRASCVVAAAHYLPLGERAWSHAEETTTPYLLVQHGLLTPVAPPLPVGATLLAWTQEDADFWRSGRNDVTTHVVGSQLLWQAAQHPAQLRDERPVFLGQLHGAELPRRGLARASEQYCRATGATYRPHPSEKDKLSRLQHAAWRRRGLEIDPGTVPLADIDRPVGSVFSTGVLEAAARGLPAWVHYDRPPKWLSEFWERYGMARWARDAHPTRPRGIPSSEPARRIAALIEELASR